MTNEKTPNTPPFPIPHQAPFGLEKDILRALRDEGCNMAMLHQQMGPEVDPQYLGQTVYALADRGWITIVEGQAPCEGDHYFLLPETPTYVINCYSFGGADSCGPGAHFPLNSYSTSRPENLLKTLISLAEPGAGIDKVEILMAPWDQDRWKGQNVLDLDKEQDKSG